jgi:hypothetical protein
VRKRAFAPPPAVEVLPPDLIPLSEGDFDDDAVRTALYLSWGNVSKAARMLNMPAGMLARRVELSGSLKADRDAARRLIVDTAEAKIVERLTSLEGDDLYDTVKFVLTTLGKEVGWGAGQPRSAGAVALTDGSRSLTVKWNED